MKRYRTCISGYADCVAAPHKEHMKTNGLVLTALAGALAMTTATLAFAQEIQVSQTRPSQPMLGSGIFTFGASYIPSIVVAAESNHPGDHDLYVPVAGPWMDLGSRHCSMGQRCDHEDLYKGLLIADGIFQALGALDIVSAFLFPETVTVTRVADARITQAKSGFRVAPIAGGSVYGVAALGVF